MEIDPTFKVAGYIRFINQYLSYLLLLITHGVYNIWTVKVRAIQMLSINQINQLGPNIQRIMIIGRSGSGKSTFGVKLSKIVNIPIFHLDKYFFESNWVERNYQEFLSSQIEIASNLNWIIDGNSTRSYEVRYKRADLCLYFNFPRWLCYWRVFKRLFNKNPKIDDRAPNCQETVRWSLLKYMWGFESRVNPILQLLQSKYPHVPIIELQSDKDVSKLTLHLSCWVH